MIRLLLSVCVVGALVIGCVSIEVGPPTAQPSLPVPTSVGTNPPVTQTEQPTAELPATPAATPAPTETPGPEATPTAELTASPEVPPTPDATAFPVENYGAHYPVFDDQMDDPNSGWGTGTNDGGSIAYVDGNLQMDTVAGGAWQWTSRLTGSTDNASHFEGVYTPEGTGYMGLACGEGEDVMWGAIANLENGDYAFIKLEPTNRTILAQGRLDELRFDSSDPFELSRFALDCAGTATGTFRMQLYQAGTNAGVQYTGAPGEGPVAIDTVAIYTESLEEPYSLTVDYLIGYGGDGDISPTPEEEELMSHIPVDWQPDCFDAFADVRAVGATANILCQLFDGRSEYADYTSFDTAANMDAYFQFLVEKYPFPEPGESCETGPRQSGYTIGGEPAGQLLCAPDPLGGTRLFWTHDELLILSDLDDNDGSYADMYADWLIAGPD